MELKLSPVEARVLGCLMEKEVTTPDQYPLSLNALTTACNQKSNRDPVMELREEIVADALDHLRRQHLAWERHSTGARVQKYAHGARDRFKLDEEESALLALLLLRGPQTPGELRSRASRLADFRDPAHVEEVLARLAADEHGPLAAPLPRRPGTREARWTHLLSGEPKQEEVREDSADDTVGARAGQPDRPAVRVRARGPSEDDRISALEREVAALRAEVEQLKSALVRLSTPAES